MTRSAVWNSGEPSMAVGELADKVPLGREDVAHRGGSPSEAGRSRKERIAVKVYQVYNQQRSRFGGEPAVVETAMRVLAQNGHKSRLRAFGPWTCGRNRQAEPGRIPPSAGASRTRSEFCVPMGPEGPDRERYVLRKSLRDPSSP